MIALQWWTKLCSRCGSECWAIKVFIETYAWRCLVVVHVEEQVSGEEIQCWIERVCACSIRGFGALARADVKAGR